MKYNDYQRKLANESRFRNILDLPPPEYKVERHNGFTVMYLNGIWTIVNLKPAGTIEQWQAVVNGKLLDDDPVSMTKVYSELARLNPPARTIY